MKRYLYILLLFMLGTFADVAAQGLPPACTGSWVRYAATPDPLFVNSTFKWILDERLVQNQIIYGQGDSIDIQWAQSPGLAQVGIVETSAMGCSGDTVYTYITVMGAMIAINSQTVCEGDSVTFTDEIGAATTYLWNDTLPGTGTFTMAATQPGEYKVWVSGSNASGCTSSDTARLIVRPVPVLDLTIDGKVAVDTMLCGEQTVSLDAGFSGVFYNWSTGDMSPVITVPSIDPSEPDSFKRYTVTIENEHGCFATDSVAIIRCLPPAGDNVPLAFTPNGDGKNDTWRIPYLEFYTDATVDVYDRWGRLVFSHKRGSYKPWNGKSDGKDLAMGNYFFIIQVSKNTKPITGTVMIIR